MTQRRTPDPDPQPSGDEGSDPLSFSAGDDTWDDLTGPHAVPQAVPPPVPLPEPPPSVLPVEPPSGTGTQEELRRLVEEAGLSAPPRRDARATETGRERVPRQEASWRPALAREQPFQPPARREPAARERSAPRAAPGLSPTPSRPAAGKSSSGPLRREPTRDDSALLGNPGLSSLDSPRRLIDLGTGLPTFTSLFSDLRPLTEPPGVTVLYVHVPSSVIVEERFGWEALEAYRGLVANYLVGYAQDVRRDRGKCVVARAFADDFVILTASHEQDGQLGSALADAMTRHLLAVDEETAALLQVFVGTATAKPFGKVHPERFLYRLIQQAQTEATDVSRQKISAHVRVLDRCISGELFNMVYQPIVWVEDHAIFAYEALVRCTHKELRSPHMLFNVAEQGDRIWPLSRLLRRMALRKVPELPESTCMFVNIHPLDFDDPDLLEPEGPIAQTASRLVLEVTERAAILDLDHFREKLTSLRAFGARIAIDDLGSGYSALNLVAELSPDYIKLDMTLIRGVDESPVRQNLLRNMVAFANDLGAKVVAEGVETRPELETLRDLGCHMVQGYYLSVPAPPFVVEIPVPPAGPRTPTPS